MTAEFHLYEPKGLQMNCPKCGTKCEVCPGIGEYCPNKDCTVIDDLQEDSFTEADINHVTIHEELFEHVVQGLLSTGLFTEYGGSPIFKILKQYDKHYRLPGAKIIGEVKVFFKCFSNQEIITVRYSYHEREMK